MSRMTKLETALYFAAATMTLPETIFTQKTVVIPNSQYWETSGREVAAAVHLLGGRVMTVSLTPMELSSSSALRQRDTETTVVVPEQWFYEHRYRRDLLQRVTFVASEQMLYVAVREALR